MQIPPSIKRKALVLADLVARGPLLPLLRKYGIKDKRYGKRLERQLRTTFSLDPAPRSGRPPVYTPDQLEAARGALASPSPPFHTAAQLVQHLKEQGTLAADAPKRGFMAAFKRYMSLAGQRLRFGTRTKLHGLTAADAKERLVWCRRMQHKITDATVATWYFVDEKTLNSRGKLIGERWLGRRRSMAGCSTPRQRCIGAAPPPMLCCSSPPHISQAGQAAATWQGVQ